VKKPFLHEPTRWADEPTEGAPAERAMGAAFRRIRAATEPSQVELQRLVVRGRGVSRGRTVHRVARVAIAIALIIAMGGAVGAALIGWRYVAVTRSRSSSPASSEATASRRAGAVRRHRAADLQMARPVEPAVSMAHEAPVPLVPSEAPEPLAESEPAGAPVPSVPSLPSRAVAAAAPPPNARRMLGSLAVPSGEPSEAAALAEAFRQLQPGGDASAALRFLDAYARQFPEGTLGDEARIARADALITLGRRMEALRLLEEIEASGSTPTRQVRITRAELLVEVGRCASAMRDFDVVLSGTRRDGVAGRALYGRASCSLRAGDTAGARADLRRYVADFPDGAAVVPAREALESMP
jgi:hypothetical protein